jgi:hypothetical protein
MYRKLKCCAVQLQFMNGWHLWEADGGGKVNSYQKDL